MRMDGSKIQPVCVVVVTTAIATVRHLSRLWWSRWFFDGDLLLCASVWFPFNGNSTTYALHPTGIAMATARFTPSIQHSVQSTTCRHGDE